MYPILLPVSSLICPEKLDPNKIDTIESFISTFGFYCPLVVRPLKDRYQVIQGGHKLAAAKRLDYERVPCIQRPQESLDLLYDLVQKIRKLHQEHLFIQINRFPTKEIDIIESHPEIFFRCTEKRVILTDLILAQVKPVSLKENHVHLRRHFKTPINLHRLKSLLNNKQEDLRILTKDDLFSVQIDDILLYAHLDPLLDHWGSEHKDSLKYFFSGCSYLKDIFNIPNIEEIPYLPQFIDCISNARQEINHLPNRLYQIDKRGFEIIQKRMSGKTLSDIGKDLKIGRERVRQLEAKFLRRFRMFFPRHLLRAFTPNFLPVEQIRKIFPESTDFFLYCLKSSYYWCDALDGLFLSFPDQDAVSLAQNMPNIFAEEEIPSSDKLVLRAINNLFQYSHGFYYRGKFSKKEIYQAILKKHYPQGIHAYKELKPFKEKIVAIFGANWLPPSDKSLSIGIADSGVLCGRGRYIHPSYIQTNNFQKIYDYARKNTKITYKDLSKKFPTYDQYLIHGILRHKYPTKFIFKKDYLLARANTGS